jgi:hypothetical protein
LLTRAKLVTNQCPLRLFECSEWGVAQVVSIDEASPEPSAMK